MYSRRHVTTAVQYDFQYKTTFKLFKCNLKFYHETINHMLNPLHHFCTAGQCDSIYITIQTSILYCYTKNKSFTLK
jgi:Gpi18-like mannosyltransferase